MCGKAGSELDAHDTMSSCETIALIILASHPREAWRKWGRIRGFISPRDNESKVIA